MIDEQYFTPREIAERLQVDEVTARKMFEQEPGVLIIAFPRKGKRVYRTVRVPASVLKRVLTRLTRVQ